MAHITLRRSSRKINRMPINGGPRPSTVRALLNYSKALKVVQLPPMGEVDLVLN